MLGGTVFTAVSLAQGVEEFFSSSTWEVCFGRVRLQPCLYQDDIGRMASSLLEAEAGNKFLATMLEMKLLNF